MTHPPTHHRSVTTRIGMRWLVIACALLAVAWTRKAKAEPLGPEDVPDVGVGALEDHPIPSTPTDYINHEVGWALFAYPRDARAHAEPLVESANEVRRVLREELGQAVLMHVEVRVAPDFDHMAKLAPQGLPPPKHANGVAYPRYRLILLSLAPQDGAAVRDLDVVYRHELAHVALFDAVGGNDVPRWFDEGYAIRFSEENEWSRKRALWEATVTDTLLPLSELARSPLHGGEESLANAQTADFLRFLLRRQDRDRFKKLIAKLERGETFEPALQAAYSAPVRNLEREWHDDLDERYSFLPLFAGVGLLGIVLGGVLGVRARQRRIRKVSDVRTKRRAVERTRAKAPPVRVTLTSRSVAETIDLAVLHRDKPGDVPKVEHDGKWHTLH